MHEFLKCAIYPVITLQVPLDHSNPGGEKAAIAVIKLSANISSRSDEYGGPVLINPGGPGASGVDMLLWRGKLLQTIIGKRFDIVGFDPRGSCIAIDSSILWFSHDFLLLHEKVLVRRLPLSTRFEIKTKPVFSTSITQWLSMHRWGRLMRIAISLGRN